MVYQGGRGCDQDRAGMVRAEWGQVPWEQKRVGWMDEEREGWCVGGGWMFLKDVVV